MTIQINKWPNWLKIAIVIIAGLIVISCIRGCQHFKTRLSEGDQYKQKLDSVSLSNDILAVELAKVKQENADTLALRDAELSISNNKLQFYQDTLDAANDRIDALLKRYKAIQPSSDTNITTVPNEYINDCAECFTELQNGKDLVKRAYAEKDNQEYLLKSKINTQSNTISKLELINGQLKSNLDNLLKTSKDNINKIEPRRILYFSMATIAIDQYTPSGIGLGFMYMDKRMRLFGGNAFTTNKGPIYQIQLSMPLSFKR